MQHLILSAAADPRFQDGFQRIGLAVLGVVCAALALLLMAKRREYRRTQAVLMFVAGLALAGIGGAVRGHIEHLLTRTGASVSTWAFGVGVPWVLALVLVMWLALDMDVDGLFNKARGKKDAVNRHKPTAFTPWLALLVPGVITLVPFLADLPTVITAALS